MWLLSLHPGLHVPERQKERQRQRVNASWVCLGWKSFLQSQRSDFHLYLVIKNCVCHKQQRSLGDLVV